MREPIFNKPENVELTEEEKYANSKTLTAIFLKILRAFKILNFDLLIAHGDIKPDNLLLTEKGGIWEPRINDFDLHTQMLENLENARWCRPKNPLYAFRYRAPELKKFGVNPMFTDEENRRFVNEYRFDLLFREEAYALGVALKNIRETNKHLIDLHYRPLLTFHIKICMRMTLTDVSIRMTTFEAFNKFEDYLLDEGFELDEAYRNSQELNPFELDHSNQNPPPFEFLEIRTVQELRIGKQALGPNANLRPEMIKGPLNPNESPDMNNISQFLDLSQEEMNLDPSKEHLIEEDDSERNDKKRVKKGYEPDDDFDIHGLENQRQKKIKAEEKSENDKEEPIKKEKIQEEEP